MYLRRRGTPQPFCRVSLNLPVFCSEGGDLRWSLHFSHINVLDEHVNFQPASNQFFLLPDTERKADGSVYEAALSISTNTCSIFIFKPRQALCSANFRRSEGRANESLARAPIFSGEAHGMRCRTLWSTAGCWFYQTQTPENRFHRLGCSAFRFAKARSQPGLVFAESGSSCDKFSQLMKCPLRRSLFIKV